MTNFLKIYAAVFVFACIWIASGCTTQKVRGEYSGLKKVYHNTTQRYNGYFNATVLLEESRATLTQQHVDNYNKILPIFPASEADNPQAVAEPLDEAMKKVSVAVNLHRGANWTDDCYLLLGQAQYFKQDYETAEETFEFMEVEFSNDLKKRGSLSERAREREKATKAEREKYRKERMKEIQEERKEREDTRKDDKKAREKAAKAKKKARDKERKDKLKADKAYKKEMAAYKKAVAAARKKGSKPPPRPQRPGRSNKAEEEKTVKNDEPREKKKEKEPEEEITEKTAAEEENKPDMLTEPESYFLKHRPALRESMMWLARTYIERENWIMANNKLTALENDPKISKEVAEQLPLVRAYYFTAQKKYDEALPWLETAIEVEEDRLKKARYAYIVAQIQDKSGNASEALAGYERVLKFRPGYTMEFSARLNILNSQYQNGRATAEATNKELNRLLKDIKNEEYQDQIYFMLAQIAFADNKTDEAIAYLESSLSVPTSNKANQAEAYYKLANIYLEREDYVNAKSYFDSVIGILPKSDERYEQSEIYAKNLTDIAANLQTIELQDSLLRLSLLTDEERRTRTFEIKKAKNEARRQAILDKANGTSNILAGNSSVNRAGTQASSFFAYDDRALKKGARDFLREWGERPLKDNWRLGEEEISEEDPEEELESLAETVVTDEDVEALFKDVPDTPEAKAEAEKKIEEAMFNLGRLYRDKLDYNEKTVEILEELLKRNPQTEYEPDALYYLYLAYTDLGNSREADVAKSRLLADYPNTTFARVIKEPDYAKNMGNADYQLNRYYDDTYSDFKRGEYKAVQVKLQEVPGKFGETNTLAPRFALLNAMTIGNLQGREQYVAALKDVIAKYPKTPEQTRAKEILRLLGEKGSSNAAVAGGSTDGDRYTYQEDKLHYMIVVFEDGDIPLTDMKVKVSDYHNKYHKLDKLRISNIYLGTGEDKIPLIVVRRFKDKDTAMTYYDGVQKNSGDFVTGGYKLYPVTQDNYRQILKNKSLDGYDDFFELNYK